MYQYTYADISYGIMARPEKRSEEIEQIINEHAARGWRYINLIPIDQTGGRITHAKLVFEKNIQE